MNLSSILAKLGISSSFTQDVTLLIVVVLASFIFGVFIGRSRLISVLISAYISVAVISVVPVAYLSDYNYQVIAFLALLIILVLSGRKMFEVSISGVGSGFMWRVFLLSFLEVILVASIVISFLPAKIALGYVSPSSYVYLASQEAKLIWMVAPLVFLLFIQKRVHR